MAPSEKIFEIISIDIFKNMSIKKLMNVRVSLLKPVTTINNKKEKEAV